MNFSPDDNYSIYHTLTIKASAEKVFDAISDPKHLVNWWPKSCSGAPLIGNSYNFFFTEEYNWYGKVVAIIPNKSIHIKMTESDQDWEPTAFGFELEEAAENITLKFSHTNWKSCNDHFKISSYCWAILLQGLKNYLEKGVIIPFDERE